ncbi:MAG TPA: TIR domain-containing protein [Allosphingosinicella sp.]
MDRVDNPLLFIISEPVGSPIANEIAYRLADHGVRTWIGSLAPTGELDEAAMEAMGASAAALLLFDQAAANSRHVDRHLLVARQTGKPLIPLRIEPTDEGLLRQELLDAAWVDWADPGEAVAEVARRTHEYAAAAHEQAEPLETALAGSIPGGTALGALGASSGFSEARPPNVEVRRSQAAPTGHDQGASPDAAPAERPGSARVKDGSERRWSGRASAMFWLVGLAIIAAALLYTAGVFTRSGDPESRQTASREEAVEDGLLPEESAEAAPVVPSPAQMEPVAAEPQVQPVRRPQPAEPADGVGAGSTEQPERSPEPTRAAAAGGGSALGTVRAFYSALGRGDGASAAQLVVPGKRGSGPLSAQSLSRYYSSFRRPLRIRGMTPVGDNSVRVAYDYVLGDGRLCRGQATVNVVQSGDQRLVSGIRTSGPC